MEFFLDIIDKINRLTHADEKSNEIPATIDLLKIIDIKNIVVTWDALNTQKSIVEAVIKIRAIMLEH